MKESKQQQVVENIKNRRQIRSVEILEKTRSIRKKITDDTGNWDGVEVLRHIRYAS